MGLLDPGSTRAWELGSYRATRAESTTFRLGNWMQVHDRKPVAGAGLLHC